MYIYIIYIYIKSYVNQINLTLSGSLLEPVVEYIVKEEIISNRSRFFNNDLTFGQTFCGKIVSPK